MKDNYNLSFFLLFDYNNYVNSFFSGGVFYVIKQEK